MTPENRILIDVDGVLGDFVARTLNYLRKEAGVVMAPEDFREFDILPAIPEEYRDFTKECWRSPGFCAGIEVYPGAVEAVDQLRGIAEVRFVTTPLPKSATWYRERHDWLAHHFSATDDEIIFASDKNPVAGDVLIDDKTATVVGWVAKRLYFPFGAFDPWAVLWRRPWNEAYAKETTDLQVARKVRHDNDWSDVINIIQGYYDMHRSST